MNSQVKYSTVCDGNCACSDTEVSRTCEHENKLSLKSNLLVVNDGVQ